MARFQSGEFRAHTLPLGGDSSTQFDIGLCRELGQSFSNRHSNGRFLLELTKFPDAKCVLVSGLYSSLPKSVFGTSERGRGRRFKGQRSASRTRRKYAITKQASKCRHWWRSGENKSACGHREANKRTRCAKSGQTVQKQIKKVFFLFF